MQIDPSWQPLFDQYTFDIDDLYDTSKPSVYPPRDDIFRVFTMPVTDIRIVLLGQDPYHGPGQAHGLAFSVPDNIQIPPSLRNIYKELQQEFPERNYKFHSGNLKRWADEERIFLLNTSLTVEEHRPNSHVVIWSEFTDDVIRFIDKNNTKCVFLLLGNYAKYKAKLINNTNRIVTGVHPSPLSASKGFFGSDIFRKVELLLGEKVNWAN